MCRLVPKAFHSLNVVGYAQSQLDNDYGAVMTGAQFVDCNGEGSISLSAITPVAAATPVADLAGCIEIQTLDNAGLTVDSYVWNGEGWEGDENATFASGTGLWVFNSVGAEDVVSIQTAGMVSTDDVIVSLDNDYGAVAVANPFPIAVALAEILPESDALTAEELAGNVEIQTLDNAGLTIDSYVWNGDGWEGDGNKTFKPGTGLWVFNSVGAGASVKLRIPGPEL